MNSIEVVDKLDLANPEKKKLDIKYKIQISFFEREKRSKY